MDKEEKIELRPYQKEWCNNIVRALRNNKSVMGQSMTGSGKTVMAAALINFFLNKGLKTLFISDRIELIEQTDNTLKSFGIDSGIIKADIKEDYSKKSQIASIQTLINREIITPDVIFIDEAHGVQENNSYGKVCKRFVDAKIIGMTGTPSRIDGNGFTDIFDKLVLGPTYNQLLKDKYLVPLDYYIGSQPDINNINIKYGDYDELEAEKAMMLVPLVESYIEHAKGKSCIIFAVSISHSKHIVEEYSKKGISVVHLDGEMDKNERKRIVKDFKNGIIKLISNVGLFVKGFDYKELECIQLATPTKSLTKFLQCIGRVSRIARGKTSGIVLDNASCYIDHGLPTNDFDWVAHFVGEHKRRKSKIEDFIEIIEFVYEKEDGETFTTREPKEAIGAKLVNIKKSVMSEIVDYSCLIELNKQLLIGDRIKHVKKHGYFALKNFIQYCEKKHIKMDDFIWKSIEDVLINIPNKKMRNLDKDDKLRIKLSSGMVHYSAIKKARITHDTKINQIKKYIIES